MSKSMILSKAAAKSVPSITVKIDVSLECIANTLVSAFEGGSNYWIEDYRMFDPISMIDMTTISPDDNTAWPSYIKYPLSEGGAIEIIPIEKPISAETKRAVKPMSLNLQTIEKGLSLMSKCSPQYFGQLISEEGDATTADVFLQYCIFGEIIFG